tara:strand:+ start:1947 stop:2714 length:768 start_codon:yes stop_codon:yes gene_type:complete
MTEDEKKKKKGVAIVIAVTPHAPKKPEDTMKPDEKMEKAWKFLKEALDPRVTGGSPAKNLRDNPGQLERILGDLEESRDFGLGIQRKPTQSDFHDELDMLNVEDPDLAAEKQNRPSEIPVEDSMDDVREEEERDEKLGEGIDPEQDPEQDPLGMFSTTSDDVFNRPSKYDKEPSNPFGKEPMEGAWDSLKPKNPILGEEDFDLQTNNPGVRPSQTDFRRGDNLMVAREKRGIQGMKNEPKVQGRIDRRKDLGRDS